MATTTAKRQELRKEGTAKGLTGLALTKYVTSGGKTVTQSLPPQISGSGSKGVPNTIAKSSPLTQAAKTVADIVSPEIGSMEYLQMTAGEKSAIDRSTESKLVMENGIPVIYGWTDYSQRYDRTVIYPGLFPARLEEIERRYPVLLKKALQALPPDKANQLGVNMNNLPDQEQSVMQKPTEQKPTEQKPTGEKQKTPEEIKAEQDAAKKADMDMKTQNALAKIDQALATGQINANEAKLYKDIVTGWPMGQEINLDNILTQVQKQKTETIDPYWSEQIKNYEDQIKSSLEFQIAQREQEREVEKATAGENIRQAQGSLEARGMTFTGEGGEQLGALSAYAIPGSEEAKTSAMPLQTATTTPTADQIGQTFVQTPQGFFLEGTVNQANRLMSSSSLARYQQNLKELGKAAEQQLGTAGALGLNIPYYTAQEGGYTGNIPTQKNVAYATVAQTALEQEKARLKALADKQASQYTYPQ